MSYDIRTICKNCRNKKKRRGFLNIYIYNMQTVIQQTRQMEVYRCKTQERKQKRKKKKNEKKIEEKIS